jgi:hypothetical protein
MELALDVVTILDGERPQYNSRTAAVEAIVRDWNRRQEDR